MITGHHAKYYAHELSIRSSASGVERLSQSLFDAKIDLNPHQIEAALFALKNPLSKGVIMADEVGLGKTIEAGLVLCQYWAERKRRLLTYVQLRYVSNGRKSYKTSSTYRRRFLIAKPGSRLYRLDFQIRWSNRWYRLFLITTPNELRTCLLYTSPSPRD